MSGPTPQAPPRRGHHGRPRSANESARGKGLENAANKIAKDKGSETTGKSETTKPARTKPQNEGEKLVVRRLPPAMTEEEFISILGPEWEVSKGKVDWFSYAPGKVSKDLSKPSRPSRAYIHVMRKDDIMPLSEVVRSKTWEDAKGTFTSPSLIGPPAVEFCCYKKVPSNKRRTDTRQGTIDQDPEFMAFLESLANPTQPKDIEAEDEDADKAESKVTTTPLVEFLKEKKANKGKDSSSKKSARNAQSDGKGKGGSKEDESTKKKGKASKDDKSDKPKETVKILTKKAATEQAAEAAKNAASQISAANNADAPKSRRAGIAAAARILQRDLGLSPGSAHRRARQDAAKADSESKSDGKATTGKDATPAGNGGSSTGGGERPASPAPSDAGSQAPKAKTQSGRRNRGGKNAEKAKATEATSTQPAAPPNPPVILKKKPEGENGQSAAVPEPANSEQAKPAQNGPKASGNKSQGQKKTVQASPDATRAFVKHVNASQGANEATLKEALESFGAVTTVEIDKRKGFAYVDFAEHGGLVKAIAASPVTVGQSSVQILERKDKKPAGQAAAAGGSGAANTSEKSEKSSGRGRRGRGGGGGKNTGNDKSQPAAPSTNNNGAGGG